MEMVACSSLLIPLPELLVKVDWNTWERWSPQHDSSFSIARVWVPVDGNGIAISTNSGENLCQHISGTLFLEIWCYSWQWITWHLWAETEKKLKVLSKKEATLMVFINYNDVVQTLKQVSPRGAQKYKALQVLYFQQNEKTRMF